MAQILTRLVILLVACCVAPNLGKPAVKLPVVKFELDLKGKPEKGTSSTENQEDYPLFNDINDEHMQCILLRAWLYKYKYLSLEGDIPQDKDLDLKTCLTIITPGIVKVKIDYGLKPEKGEITGELTPEVLKYMSAPRCANTHYDDDNDKEKDKGLKHKIVKRYTSLGSTTWKKMPVTISFSNYLPGIAESEQKRIALHCAKLWSDNSGLSFAMASPGQTGNINIMAQYIDGKWNTIGQGLSPNTWSNPPSSYLKLDTSETWKEAGSGGYGVSLTWAICHEMGHNLAMGHSHHRGAIMYPSGTGQDESRLHHDDIQGIQKLYGGPGRKIVSPPSPTTHTVAPPRRYTPQRYTPQRYTPRRYTTPRTYRRRYPTRAPVYNPPKVVYTTRRHSTRKYAPPGHSPRYDPRRRASLHPSFQQLLRNQFSG